MNPQKQRIVLMVLAGIFGLLVLIGVGLTIYQSQKGKVVTTITPHDATVKLDGREIPGNGTQFVEPGRHEFVITRTAFVEKKIPFEIKAGETQNFDLFIVPDENAGLEWVKQNPNEAMELDGRMSQEYIEEGERLFASHQILSELPIVDRLFRISHGTSKTGKDFALYIQASDQEGRTAALETLKYMGYDPVNYEIIYTQPN